MLFWDEDDRLNLVAGDGYLSYYAYGNDGNRAIKMTGNAAIDQTATLLNSTNLENITIYPSEYLTVTQAEYTKYYYAGGNRIASKIGTGGFEKMQQLCTLDQNLTANANTLLNFVLYQVTNTTQPPTDEYPVDVCGGYSVATELLADPLPDFYISQTNLNFTQNNLLQQLRQNLTNSVEPVYYFHSDHLGSASWITNNTGLPVQHLLYLPFGEHFVNERSAAYDERFTFTGKERDAETGYYYHGARFNSSDIGWLSVDPMADKYPSMSPYAYCAWNPVKLVDPEGMEAMENDDWYTDRKGRLKWDPVVTKETTLKKGEVYLGKTVLFTNDDGQIVYGDEQGKLYSFAHFAKANINADATTSETDADVAVPVALPFEVFLWKQISTTAEIVLEATVAIAWIIPACLLLSSDSSPRQNEQGKSKSRIDDVADAKESSYQPFAHDTKKNGKLKGNRSDCHDAQYNHGGKKRKPNPNQRKGADERRNRGKRIN